MSFFALRDIAVDEELTFSYLDDEIPPKERKELIFSSWNFHCNCKRCRSDFCDGESIMWTWTVGKSRISHGVFFQVLLVDWIHVPFGTVA